MSRELTNKPLVEAIFEIKWELQDSPSGGKIDPNYKILVGMLYEKLNQDYPFIEPLETASMPDEIRLRILLKIDLGQENRNGPLCRLAQL